MMLFETIKTENGNILNITGHNQRMNRSRRLLFNTHDQINLVSHIRVPDECSEGVFKCRVIYGKRIEKVEFERVVPQNIRKLRLITANGIEYSHKYADRSALTALLTMKEDCDDIIIVKNGLVTDASFANLVFFDGQKWITPSTPLLRGTRRQLLLDQGMISEAVIRPRDLPGFSRVSLINAMRDIDRESQILICT
ncbi:MAG: aminotransferase class IV [Bacteroidales bacterium]|nr:aminotransferase class IV [Bacteroidales bacterium]